MSEPPPKYETGKRGRPANGDYTSKIFARISDEQRAYVNRKNKAGETDSEYIRRLIDRDREG